MFDEEQNSNVTSQRLIPGFRKLNLVTHKIVPTAETLVVESPKFLDEFWEKFQHHLLNQNQESQIPAFQSTLIKFLAPVFGGPNLQGRRASPQEISKAINFLGEVPLIRLSEGIVLVEAYFEELELSSEQRRPHRSRVNGT